MRIKKEGGKGNRFWNVVNQYKDSPESVPQRTRHRADRKSVV